jgi:hypothetical protein
MPVEVFANLGAEEGARWRQAIEHPAARTLAHAFASLFDPPAFAWLPSSDGLYPWLATDEAAAEAARRDLPLLGPGVGAVRQVHDKAFAHRAVPVDDPASAAMLVLEPADLDDAEAARERIAAHVDAHAAWYRCGVVLKPRWGTSGRGRLSWSPTRGTSLAEALGRRGLRRLRSRHGAGLEPWLTRQQDFSTQILIPAEGAPRVLATARLDVRPAGVYLGNHGVIGEDGRPTAGADEQRLLPGALAAARAAQAAGFVGPCGVDAFIYRDLDGGEALRAVVEVNARMTGGTILTARVQAAVDAGRAGPGDRFRYDAGADQLTIERA